MIALYIQQTVRPIGGSDTSYQSASIRRLLRGSDHRGLRLDFEVAIGRLGYRADPWATVPCSSADTELWQSWELCSGWGFIPHIRLRPKQGACFLFIDVSACFLEGSDLSVIFVGRTAIKGFFSTTVAIRARCVEASLSAFLWEGLPHGVSGWIYPMEWRA